MTKSERRLLLALVAATGLAGCGGGDGIANPVPPPAATSDVPQSALGSAQAYSDYVGSMPASNTGEPLALGDISPPTSDTTEPQPLS